MNYFEDVELFSGLSYSDGEMLSGFCQKQGLSKGDFLFRQWDEAQAMYLISSGCLAIYKDGEFLVNLEKGDVVWEMAFLNPDSMRNADVKAAIDSEVITLIDFSIQQMFQKNPELHEKIKRIIESRK